MLSKGGFLMKKRILLFITLSIYSTTKTLNNSIALTSTNKTTSLPSPIQESDFTRFSNNQFLHNLEALAHHFPSLAQQANKSGSSVHRIASDIQNQIKNQTYLKLSWGDTLQQQHYIAYLLSHLEDITATINPSAQIIHTTLGDAGTLPLYLMARSLVSLGFKNITINVIQPEISNAEINLVQNLIQQDISTNQRFLLNHYITQNEYIEKIKNSKTKTSNSYQISTPTRRKTSFTQEVATKRPSLYSSVNELILTTEADEKITIELHHSIPATITAHGSSAQTQECLTLLSRILNNKDNLTPRTTTRWYDRWLNVFNKQKKQSINHLVVEKIAMECESRNIGVLLVSNHERSRTEEYHELLTQTTATKVPIAYILNNDNFKKHEAIYG